MGEDAEESRIRQARKAKDGSVILVVDSKAATSAKIRDKIAQEIKEASIIIRGNKRYITLHIKDMDGDTSREEVESAIRKKVGEERYIKVGSLRPSYGGSQATTVQMTKNDAETLIREGSIRIGLARYRVREWLDIKRCFRCWESGHDTRYCKGEDRTNKCQNCGKEGHRIKECTEESYCPLCEENAHRAWSANCGKMKELLTRTRAYQRPPSQGAYKLTLIEALRHKNWPKRQLLY